MRSTVIRSVVKYSVLIHIIFIVLTVSCSKNERSPIQGKWRLEYSWDAKYGGTQSRPEDNLVIVFNEDGNLVQLTDTNIISQQFYKYKDNTLYLGSEESGTIQELTVTLTDNSLTLENYNKTKRYSYGRVVKP